ncbi:MAG TPA: SMP-30/gluconolactonase/LRE family protein [Bryobacteraceae bacterium]|nr:SMP-30/gluconolactonase/LRE family protein [Bryobacteraceae bacterium]
MLRALLLPLFFLSGGFFGQNLTSQDIIYKIEAVSTKHKFLEGPVWSAHDGYLLFSDVPSNKILKIDTKGITLFREQSGGASGNAFDDKGRLYTCETRARRVVRTDKKDKIEVLADQFDGKKLNGPNDIVVTKNEQVFFTDPAFGSAVEVRELPFYGVFHISAKGVVSAAVKLQTRPNGLALSPDGATLYVSNSDERNVRAYDVNKDGALSNERMFVPKTEGVPSGLEVDEKGNVYVAASEIGVFTPEGQKTAVIHVADKPSNMVFGDGDLHSLYVTARSTLYRVKFDTVKGAALY